MYPVLFRIAGIEITSFGVLMAIAMLVGIRLFARELARSRLPEDAVNAALAGALGGVVGAKLVWAIEFSGTEPFMDLLLSRGGFSWFGGFAGGAGTGLWMLRRHGIPLVRGLAAATPALAVGHAIGRIGCFLVGDDYGRSTDLPWGVAFPLGLPPTNAPVHPTQLYEAVLLAPLALLLIRWRRRGVADAVVLGRYLVLAGLFRFTIEFVRVNRQIVGPLTLAQLLALGLMAAGWVMLMKTGKALRG